MEPWWVILRSFRQMPERKGHPTHEANKGSGSALWKFPGSSCSFVEIGGTQGGPAWRGLQKQPSRSLKSQASKVWSPQNFCLRIVSSEARHLCLYCYK